MEDSAAPAGASTSPANLNVALRNFDSEDRARRLGSSILFWVTEIGRRFDLASLDGITVAYDYSQALIELDRGFKGHYQLAPTNSHAVGVAMTPAVLREEVLKSHIVLNAALMVALEDEDDENFGRAVYTLAHECAHVEITQRYDATFPGEILRQECPNARFAFRSQTIMACWNEYAATRFSAGIGKDMTQEFEDAFIQPLAEARDKATELVVAFQTHKNILQLLTEVYGICGNLLKWSAYHLGNLEGRGVLPAQMPRTVAALVDHWFAPYFERLKKTCEGINNSYGNWADKSSFEAVGDLAEKVVVKFGLQVTDNPDGGVHVDIVN